MHSTTNNRTDMYVLNSNFPAKVFIINKMEITELINDSHSRYIQSFFVYGLICIDNWILEAFWNSK